MYLNLANKLTLVRIVLIPFFIACLIYYNIEKDYLRWLALIIFILAALTDMIDGYIARTKKQKTVIGSFLDPLADKFLITISLVCLSMQNIPQEYRIPIWVLIAVISRDIILVAGSALMVVTKHHIEIIPSKLGKLTTLFQMLTIVMVLLHIPRFYLRWAWGAVVVLTIASGLQYLQRGSILLNEPRSAA